VRLSVQCYTVRDAFAKDVWKTFADLREIGFNFVELAGHYSLSPKELRKGLDALGLQVSGSHVSLDALDGDIEKVIEDAYTLDNRYIILPWVGEREYAGGWDGLGRRLDGIGERIREAGLWFAYHNHAFEFAEVDGKRCLDILFDNCAEEHVLAELDTCWVAAGGEDPAAWIARYGRRCPLVHLKDLGPDNQDAPAGQGSLDWDAILRACNASDVEFGVIEMDNPPGEAIDDVRACAGFFLDRSVSF
jgi:sugar phosphate isomerase/epimerase